MKNFIFTLTSVLFISSLFGSSCPNDVIFNSQSDIDNFVGCDSVMGNLIISGSDIVSLSNLNSISYVSGEVQVSGNMVLNDLTGLNSIVTIGNSLFIVGNDGLTSINDFTDLELVETIEIDGNNNLISIDGFQNLDSCFDMRINFNPNLNSFDACNVLRSIGNDLEILGNDVIIELQGFNLLQTVFGSVSVNQNFLLEEITGFNNLAVIDQNLNISENYELFDISGLSSLVSVGGDLDVFDNLVLNNCCSLYPLLDQLGVSGSINIFDNDVDCNSETEILTVCVPMGSPCDTNIIFTSQLEVDNFPGCDTIHGTLEISGADITDLSNLNSIVYIDGDLLIHDNTALTKLESFSLLDAVNGQIDIKKNGIQYITNFQNITSAKHLKIRGNNNLTEMKLMPGLSSVRNVVIANNRSLKYFAGLHNLTQIFGQVKIHNNRNLKQFEAFPLVTDIKRHFVLSNNNALISFSGLSLLTSVGQTVKIHKNGRLTSFPELANLQLAETIEVTKNASLDNLEGFRGLIKADFMIIEDNDALTSLDGLDNLQTIGTDLTIQNNPVLNYCCAIYPLLDQAQVGGVTTIQNNDADCNSEAIILQDCGISAPCSDAPENLQSWNYFSWKVFEWDSVYGASSCRIYAQSDTDPNWYHIANSWTQDPSWAVVKRNIFNIRFRNSNYVQWQVSCQCQTTNGAVWSPWSQSDTIWNNGSYKMDPEINGSIAEKLDLSNFRVYPNPSNGAFTFEFRSLYGEQNANLSIYDFSGRLVYENKQIAAGISELNLEFLSNGIYHVKLRRNNGDVDDQKLIISK